MQFRIEQEARITDVKTYIENDPGSEVSVAKNEIVDIRDYVNPAPANEGAEIVKEHTHYGVYLNPKRGSFDGDPKDWSFRRGGEIVVATIRDKEFMERCVKGEYRLNYSDLLIVDLLERQRIQGTMVLKPAYEIIRVTSYIKGPEQQRLDIPPA